MFKYNQRTVTDTVLQYIDENNCSVAEALRQTGEQPLSTLARSPEVIAAVNKAREAFPKDAWKSVQGFHTPVPDDMRRAAMPVWDALPGYTSLADAIQIIARL